MPKFLLRSVIACDQCMWALEYSPDGKELRHPTSHCERSGQLFCAPTIELAPLSTSQQSAQDAAQAQEAPEATQ